jgi:hypothetical protein
MDGDGKTVLEPVTQTLRALRGSVKVKVKDVEKVRLEVRKAKAKAKHAAKPARARGKA